jgi:hypothetical protein
MTALRQARWLSAVVTCVAAFAWLVAANHCAFATIAAHSAKTAHACCHDEDGQHDQSLPAFPQSMQCCDTLKAAVPVQAVAPAVSLYELQPAWIESENLPNLAAAQSLVIAPATGPPPRAETFVEVVLNRSLLAHAPPVFVA